MGNIAPKSLPDCSWVFSNEDGEAPRLLLRVHNAPIQTSLGAVVSGLKAGDEVDVFDFRTFRGLDALRMRYVDVHAHPESGPEWPLTYRFTVFRRAWQVDMVDRKTQAIKKMVLQMAAEPSARSRSNVNKDVDDSKKAAAYAHKFNMQQLGEDQKDVKEDEINHGVKIAAPAGCEIVDSSFPAMFQPGDFCTLTPYHEDEVEKFLFSGRERFLDLPQALFHYAAWLSNGKELMCDLQGCSDDDGNLILMDPVIIQSGADSAKDVICGPVGMPRGGLPAMFEQLHPRCGQACRVFDPQRTTKGRHVGCGQICGF